MAFKMKGSPFKMDDGPGKDKKKSVKKATVNAARQLLKDEGINNPNLSDSDVLNAAKTKGVYGAAASQAKRGVARDSTNYNY